MVVIAVLQEVEGVAYACRAARMVDLCSDAQHHVQNQYTHASLEIAFLDGSFYHQTSSSP